MADQGDVLNFDLDDLKVGELEDLEDVLGEAGFDELMRGKLRAKTVRAVAWIIKRRDDPYFTFEDARNLKLQLGETPDPTEAAG